MTAPLLTDYVPLRKTTDWFAFRAPLAIPQRYAQASGALLQYDQAGLQYVWADHASETIDTVYVARLPVTNWRFDNVLDTAGKVVSMVTFNAPPDPTAELTAKGYGKLHPLTGQRMTNPAEIIWDLLNNVCGIATTRAQLYAFRVACAKAGIVIGGSVDDAEVSIQSQVREIADAIAAVFCSDSYSLLQLFPGGPLTAVRETLDSRFELTATGQLQDIINDTTLNFDFLNGNAQQSLEMIVPSSIAKYGKKKNSVDSKWIHDLRVAYNVAQRYLQQASRTVANVTIDKIKTPLIVGDFVNLTHPVFPSTVPVMVLGRTRNLTEDTTQVQVQVPIGAVPTVALIRSSTAFTPIQFASLTVNTQGNNRVITLLNEDGSPIINAAVTLDAEITHYTDSSGVVLFTVQQMPAGNHLVSVLCQDGRTFSQTILVT